MGKSAQFPLHVWLPDAMEGPTPVSALIHAATMVNAGVYLVARANPLFASRPEAMVIVAAIGIFTAILAASIAMTQTDIKRVLAYSTLSQLGYMFAALGVGAFTAAIFHLMTHGFFKGLLFLGSGSVIHAVHEEQDMRQMGGLSQKIPITYATMLIGSIAIAGIPPLAGFFSKDEILGEAFKLGFQWVWAIGLFVALLTAFYMFRLMGLTFWGAFRGPKEIWDRIHESPPVMTIPLILLAIPSIFLGLVLGLPLGDSTHPPLARAGLPRGRGDPRPPRSRVPAVRHRRRADPRQRRRRRDRRARPRLALLRRRHRRRPDAGRPGGVRELTGPAPFLYRASLNKWWFDDLNHLLFIVIGGRVAGALWWFDREVVDGTVNGIGAADRPRRPRAAPVQTGRVQNYALGIAIGLIVMAGSYLCSRGTLMDLSDDPDPLDRHVPAARRGARRRRPAGAALDALVALGFALATWVVSLLLLDRLPAGPGGSSSSSSRRSTGSRSSASSTSSASTACRSPWSC